MHRLWYRVACSKQELITLQENLRGALIIGCVYANPPAIFLLLSDTLARVIISPAEIRVGLITSFLGAPFFIYLLVSNRKNFYSL